MNLRGYVQAGGGSTRFGQDKALALLGGKTMLEHGAELLLRVCSGVKIVAPKGKYANLPWPVLADLWPGEGPLGGIITALEDLSTGETPGDWALVLGCDLPFLTAEFLGFLGDRADGSSALILVPRSVAGLEPLCACWRREALPLLRVAFDSGIRKVTEAMKRLPLEVLDEETWKRFDTEGRLFWNLNTRGDYEEALRVWGRGKG